MNKLNLVSDSSNPIKLRDGNILYLDQPLSVDDQIPYTTLEDLEKNLILRNWNIWPRVFIYNNSMYYNFSPMAPSLKNPQVYSNYSISNSVKFSTARRLTTKKVTDFAIKYSPTVNVSTVPHNNTISNTTPAVNPVTPGSSPVAPTPGLFGAPARIPEEEAPSAPSSNKPSSQYIVIDKDNSQQIREAERFEMTHTPVIAAQAMINGVDFDIKYSSAVLEEGTGSNRVTFNGLYSEIMNLIDSESNAGGVSMYYHLSSLYDLIKKSGVIDVITPGSPVYTSAINLSKYVRNNCICHVTVSFLSKGGTEAQKQIKFTPCKLSSNGELVSLSDRFEVCEDERLECVIECQDFCVRVFPKESKECIITNCYITYEN